MASKYQKQHYEDVASLLQQWAMGMYGEPLHVCPEHPDWDGGDAPWEQCHDPTDHVGASPCRCTAGQPSIHHLFANLFATDNPPTCIYDGNHDGPCGTACRTGGCLVGGFDRERFLKACGLESA